MTWTYFTLKEVKKLEVSGIILLYGEDRFVSSNMRPIIANEFGRDGTTLYEELKRIVNEQRFPEARYYKVSRYRVEPKFAVHYFDTFWTRNPVQRHLDFYAEKFFVREQSNALRAKPIFI